MGVAIRSRDEARSALVEIYGWFTRFDTADLKAVTASSKNSVRRNSRMSSYLDPDNKNDFVIHRSSK